MSASILLSFLCLFHGALGVATTYDSIDELTLMSASRLVVGERAVIYVDISSASGNITMTSKFYPVIDALSTMTITGSYSLFANEDARVALTLLYNDSWVNSTRSTSAKRFSDGMGNTVPYYAAWVGVQDGIAEGIAWDINCDGAFAGGLAADQCSTNRCLDNFCVEPCTATGNNGTGTSHPCDMKIYFAWKGIDPNSRAMVSGGSLPNNFNIFSSKPVFEDVAGTTQDFIYGLLNGGSAGSSVAPGTLLTVCISVLVALCIL